MCGLAGVLWVWCGGVVRRGVVWCAVVWYGAVQCSAVRCVVVWCGVVWCGALRIQAPEKELRQPLVCIRGGTDRPVTYARNSLGLITRQRPL